MVMPFGLCGGPIRTMALNFFMKKLNRGGKHSLEGQEKEF